MMKKLNGAFVTALIGLIFLGMADSAQASLIDTSVNASFSTSSGGVSISPGTNTVTTSGPEFVLDIGGGRAINIDVDGSWIDFQWNGISNGGFGTDNVSITLSGLDWGATSGSIIDVELSKFLVFDEPTSTLTTASFTSDSVTLNVNGTWGLTDRVRLDLITSHVSPVPLPAALPLYGTGLAIMGFIGWRRRRKAAAA